MIPSPDRVLEISQGASIQLDQVDIFQGISLPETYTHFVLK